MDGAACAKAQRQKPAGGPDQHNGGQWADSSVTVPGGKVLSCVPSEGRSHSGFCPEEDLATSGSERSGPLRPPVELPGARVSLETRIPAEPALSEHVAVCLTVP